MQILLLILGVGLITAAVLAFASSMVTAFEDVARVVVIGAIGVIGLVVSRLIMNRLRVTAEGVAWAGLAALGVDAALVGALEPLRDSGYRYPAVGGMLLLTIALAFALRAIPSASKPGGADARAGDGREVPVPSTDAASGTTTPSASVRASGPAPAAQLPPRPLRAYGLYAALALPWATAMLLDLPPLPRIAGDAIAAVCLGAYVTVACLWPSAGARQQPPFPGTAATAAMAAAAGSAPNSAFAGASTVAGEPAAAPTFSTANAAGPFVPAPPQTVQRATAERIILLSVSAFLLMVLSLGDFDSTLPGLPFVAVGAYLLMLVATALAWTVRPVAPSCRWIVGAFTGVTALSLMFLAVFDADRIVPADLITALFGLMALAIGAQRMAANPALRSWDALWPGLMFLFIPTLLVSWTNPSPVSTRSLLLLTAALATLLTGAFLGWQAPVTMGALVLAVHVLRQLWPWLVLISQDYWWIWLLVAGVILVVAAARYEASLKSVQSIGRRISQLR
ncbi:SCO7613 C-terminal domain-containing membrane protein [Bifidobacterium avesanii]|uniref:Uncharacterized protein n=1 Tax=Bifidobacterium avesanii TaxID=1798157 RepID=A0A7K3TFX7_9BIFI|nr:hypothetical protein [Bifidobacterium avesanii]KAB8290629.1 hypothetical protein DSM100685_1422 [Bifidobacterium avesanii]NEG77997.1 hypothetical protein [Bifidobacterium avesanii]